MKIKTLGSVTMYISVQLENGDKRVWLPLPATKKQFESALCRIGGQKGEFIIKEYNVRVPAMGRDMLRRTPLAVVNHFAARLRKLSDEDVLKLCAIGDSDFYFGYVEQFIEYTYTTDKYTLLPGICDEEALGRHHAGTILELDGVEDTLDFCKIGENLSIAENGAFTAQGYLTSEIGWNLPRETRTVPESLNLRGYIGEDLYADWDSEYII